jgi:hypothetical protein
MTRFKVTVTTYTNAPSAEEAGERVLASVGSRFHVESVETDEEDRAACEATVDQAKKTAAYALDRWREGDQLPAGLTRASSFDVVDALLRYVVAASKVGRA